MLIDANLRKVPRQTIPETRRAPPQSATTHMFGFGMYSSKSHERNRGIIQNSMRAFILLPLFGVAMDFFKKTKEAKDLVYENISRKFIGAHRRDLKFSK